MPNTPFGLFGDINQILITIALIHHLHLRQSSDGLSYKSQWLYVAAFVARYIGGGSYVAIDHWELFYDICVTLFPIVGSLYIVYLMKSRFIFVENDSDTIKLQYLLPIVFLFGFFLNDEFSPSYLSTSLKDNIKYHLPSVHISFNQYH